MLGTMGETGTSQSDRRHLIIYLQKLGYRRYESGKPNANSDSYLLLLYGSSPESVGSRNKIDSNHSSFASTLVISGIPHPTMFHNDEDIAYELSLSTRKRPFSLTPSCRIRSLKPAISSFVQWFTGSASKKPGQFLFPT